MKKSIVFYSVPQINKSVGGPKTRILKISEVLKNHFKAEIIQGTYFEKLTKSIKVPCTTILYIESSTSRLALIDVINLLILKKKSKQVFVYIRDVYIEFFPDKYHGFRGRITFYLNRFSYYFLTKISTKLFFPTKEMGEFFYTHNNKFPLRNYEEFPPGTFLPEYDFLDTTYNIKRLNDLKIIYLGGTKYENAGFVDFLNFINESKLKCTYYIISNDDISSKISKINSRNTVKVIKGISHSEVIKTLYEEKITFAIHPRPLNKYDSLTYPIKIFDFISCLLPFFTLKHKPLLNLFDANYPLFVNSITPHEIDKGIEFFLKNRQNYLEIINYLSLIREKVSYENVIKTNLK